MDATIAVLASEIIDQIAAGEVIERPASVVKELVDNAIDAGARTIAVEVDAGGRALIRVVDDGCGMSPGDALLAFERHATSKLREFDDLWSLSTLGFRGEALPSIASVSRLTLTTRRPDALSATRIVMEAGRLGAVTEVGAPAGTTVEVEELLRNVPARLKFLKSDATEASHTTELVAKIAMAYPELHIRLRHNGRIALDAPPDRDVFARAQALLGRRTAARLITGSGHEAGIRVRCVLGAPELAQTTARGVQLFVGRRPVRDRGLLHALAVGYGELVPRGRHPVAVVLIDPPDGTVDVNVHPQKAEVRFSEPSAIYAAVRHVVQAAVARAPWRDEVAAGPVVMTALPGVAPPPLPFDDARPERAVHPIGASTIDARATAASHVYAAQLREARDRDRLPIGPPAQLGLGNAARSWAYDLKQRVRQSRAAEDAVVARQTVRPTRVAHRALIDEFETQLQRRIDPPPHSLRGSAVTLGNPRRGTHPGGVPRQGFPRVTGVIESVAAGTMTPEPLAASVLASQPMASLRFLSQLDLTYLVCEGDRELVLVDQHVAHERVELARLRRRVADLGDAAPVVAAQPMLFPMTLEVPAELAALATQYSAGLARVGFDVSLAGPTTLMVVGVPSDIRHAEPARLLTELLESWRAQGPSTDAARIDNALAVIACHTALRAGDRVTPSEAQALLAALDDVDDSGELGIGDAPWNSERSARGVHTRPAVLRLTLAEIARRFGGRE